MATLLVILILLVLFVRSPWGQDFIIKKATNFVSNKTNTKVEIDKFYLTFDGDLLLKGLYLEDIKGDTLVYSKSLEADIALWPLIKGESIGIDALDWNGLRAKIIRKDTVSGYNFQFLVDAFAPSDSSVAADSTTAATNVYLGRISLEDVDVDYADEVLGIDSKFVVGKALLEIDEVDLANMSFKASEGHVENSRIKFHQSPVPIDPNAKAVPLPLLVIEDLSLKTVYVDYVSLGDGLTALMDIDELTVKIPKANLRENDIELKDVFLSNSKITINSITPTNVITENVNEVAKKVKEDVQKFDWPAYRIDIGAINLSQNEFSYQVGNAKPKKGVFDPNAIFLRNVSLQGDNVFLKDKLAGINLNQLSFAEASGFNLHNLGFKLSITDNLLNAEEISMALNNNKLKGRLKFEYKSLSDLVITPETSKIALNISSFQADLKDVFQFQPSLRQNEYIETLSTKYISGNLIANGYLSSVQIARANVQWGNSTKITTSGTITNATDPNNLSFRLKPLRASTTRNDILNFVDEKELNITLPETIAINGLLSGSVDDITTDLNITTSQGIATIKGNFRNTNTISFDASIAIEEYRLDQLMQNEQLGPISLTINGNGSGTTINSLDATIAANISSFNLNNYAIKDLAIDGNIKNGRGKVISKYKDENLNVALDAIVVLDSIASEAIIDLNIIGADLQALGLIQRDVRTGLKLSANFKGNTTAYDVTGSIDDGVVVYDNKTYLLGSFNAGAHVRKDTTALFVKNKMLDLELESNTDPLTFSKALQRHVASYFYRDAKLPDSVVNPVNLRLKGTVSQAPLLKEVFLVNIQDLDTISVAIDFKEKTRQLKAKIAAPHIDYAGNQIDSLAFTMDTDRDNFNFNLGFREINAGPFAIKSTTITGNQVNNEMNLEFLSYDGDEKLMHVQSQITGERDRLVFKVLPKDLLLNKNAWTIPATNEVIFTEKNLEFVDFKINRNGQSIAITDKLPNINKEHIAIAYNNFNLSEVLDYLNPEERFAEGILNGDLIIENPFSDTGILADLSINQFKIMDVDIGNLTLDAKGLGGSQYDINLEIQGGDVSLKLDGGYLANAEGANLDLNLDISQFKMKALEGFSQGEVSNAEGVFTGNFEVNGPISEPKYNGALNFKGATFEITKFNAAFTLADEKLKIDNQGLTMDRFTVLDENGNTLVIAGAVGTNNFLNPTFDLSIKATNFQVLNATEEDNDFLYGKAVFDANAKLTGDLLIPKLDVKATVNNTTDITYIMPSATVNIEDRNGVVVFVNRENPDAILTRAEEQTATVTGFDIAALVNVGEGAKVKIIIDEETGDNFQVYGEGEFNFTMNPNGRMNLVGVYNVSGGQYEMNLYNLVNRKFELVKGSRVSWSGDPFDAKLDVKALYNVEASASALMAAQTSGSDPALKSKFRQVLPFYVYLNVDGELLQPKISFNLDMPKDDQGAIGGQVYGRIQLLNQQEAELNKQVFSLLVLNRFYPEPGSDGSRGGAASIARDNINDALSDQLNVFSDKLLGDSGVELDFGLDSYTDYQGDSPTERTQLDIAAQKKLFNDRLIVRVGSELDIQGSSSIGESTPLIGNVSLEYILTENGRYRLKGFRRNQFENVIDGQTIASGIALIFTQEFNRFSELRDAIFFKKSKAEAEAEAEAEEKKKEESQKAEEERVKIKEEMNIEND
ncbi:translocation/assembly module TamB domain-containing protein [Ulvibacter antarcticus]|uniref:Uncharacterized protein DUF490 n=1 Tax=Ulvibacter antarcticus TaxID=442714 RepID=A0A3L9YT81_9FLAO|nr:translocation/assembly module TamB domain-containing protein [Ulvibacter antarcticus]RMA57702.1 uncharacterized protein DUF490 [Ulvibacter antarcticus]